jgi:hypothetical protein
MPTLREARAVLSWKLGLARYIFIHVPKNAGVGLRKMPELSWSLVAAYPHFHRSRAYTRGLTEAMAEAGEHHGNLHARWRDLDPRVTQRLRAVAIVRNPWARTVSRYRFGRLAVEQGKRPPEWMPDSFEGFLEQRHEDGARPYFWHRAVRGWYPQADYVTDEAGAIRADVLRFEHLDAEVPRYFGVDEPARKRNVTVNAKGDWRDFYTERTRQIVADWYARDIELFGFDFDTPATRNTTYAEAAALPDEVSAG